MPAKSLETQFQVSCYESQLRHRSLLIFMVVGRFSGDSSMAKMYRERYLKGAYTEALDAIKEAAVSIFTSTIVPSLIPYIDKAPIDNA